MDFVFGQAPVNKLVLATFVGAVEISILRSRCTITIMQQQWHRRRTDKLSAASARPVWYETPSGVIIRPDNTKHKH